MEGTITIAYLQKYLRRKDHNAGHELDYFLKLIEEIGELARCIQRGVRHAEGDQFKGTIEEEMWDVMYYLLTLANLYDVDMEKWIPIKEAYNNKRYNPDTVFEAKDGITVAYLQRYLQGKDSWPEYTNDYFLKLAEETGELSEMIYKGAPHAEGDQFKGTIEEELWDVMYYLIALANIYEVDLEKWIPVKEAYNNARYNPGIVFGE